MVMYWMICSCCLLSYLVECFILWTENVYTLDKVNSAWFLLTILIIARSLTIIVWNWFIDDLLLSKLIMVDVIQIVCLLGVIW